MHPSYKTRNVSTKKILVFSTERILKRTVHKAVVKGHYSEILCPRLFFILFTRGAYYVPNSFFFISNKFCNGGSGPSQGVKFLYAPERPEQGD